MHIFEITLIKVIPDPGKEKNCQTISIEFKANGLKYNLSSLRSKYSLANAIAKKLRRDDFIRLVEVNNSQDPEVINTIIFPECSLICTPTHSQLADKLSEYGIG